MIPIQGCGVSTISLDMTFKIFAVGTDFIKEIFSHKDSDYYSPVSFCQLSDSDFVLGDYKGNVKLLSFAEYNSD